MADGINLTQVGGEVWRISSSSVVVTMSGLEAWSPGQPGYVGITQTGAEVWRASPGVVAVTQVGSEVWYQIPPPPVVYVPGGHKNVRWRRSKQHVAFEAATLRRKHETPLAAGGINAPKITGIPRAEVYRAFFAKSKFRYGGRNKRDLISEVTSVAKLTTPAHSVTFRDFFVKEPWRFGKNRRDFAPPAEFHGETFVCVLM